MVDSSPRFLLLLLLLLLHPLPAPAQTHRNITLGSSLSPTSSNTSWLSPSGDFAFGFRPLDSDPSLFLLAIWFDRTADKTVVWSANRNTPVGTGSTLDLTADGQLSLRDQTGQKVWSPGTNTNASYAAMLDTGNLVLASSDASVQWQSFDDPTDTILPTQVLTLGHNLVSKLMDNDYSDGRFKLAVQTDGNLVMYTIAVPLGYQYDSYWSTDTVGSGSQLVYNSTGSVDLALKNGTIINIISRSTSSNGALYQRATLDPDGVFRQYSYPKNSTNTNWVEGWSVGDFVPPDICQLIFSSSGAGVCGFNSYCISDGRSPRVDCECPLQYSFIDPDRKYRGCKPDFDAQTCELDDSGSSFEISSMTDVDFPRSDYEVLSGVEEDRCRSECLRDCFCVVAIYYDGGCWKKQQPLRNGKSGSYLARKALFKVPKGSNSQPQLPGASKGKGHGKRTWIIVGSSILGSSVFMNCLLLALIILIFYNVSNKKVHNLQSKPSASGLSLRSYNYEELMTATDGFAEELGSGSFGTVYKGYVGPEPSTCVAVKKLAKFSPETDPEKEFMNEVTSIGMTYHKNLVRLLGYCNEGAERLLVYEYMSNGSLTSYLFEGPRPDWHQRIRIAMGIARGLVYLHDECVSQIIHCDIKPQNILLDDNLVARISDFGLAKLLRTDQTRTTTGIRGTRGYVAPEWFKSMGITAKVDVYSFGVMLMELISCRRNLVMEAENEDATVLTYWANDCYRDGRIDLLVEGDEEAMADMRRLERFVMVAIWCVQEEPALRPTMGKVTQMLDGSVTIPVPPDPSSYISSIL